MSWGFDSYGEERGGKKGSGDGEIRRGMLKAGDYIEYHLTTDIEILC
jgi:hypothetical protein